MTFAGVTAVSVLAETYHERPTPPPLAIGITTLAIFLVALFVVTRLNKDR
jgi:hypothetical protein